MLFCRVFIWLLFLAAMTGAPLSPSIYAEEGFVYPDTAKIQCLFEIEGDSTTVRLSNLKSDLVQKMCFSAHSAFQPVLVECVLDGQVMDSVQTDVEFNTVNPNWFTVRWEVGDFQETVDLQYVSPFAPESYFNWFAGHPYPVFGIGPHTVAACCTDRVGDANADGNDEPTIGDVSVMIDAKFISLTCNGLISCIAEADINQSGGSDPTCDDISIGDIAILIDYLFITGSSLGLAECL